MEIKIEQTKQVEAIVKFNRPLSCYEIPDLVGNAAVECIGFLIDRKKDSILKKNLYTFRCISF